LNYLRNLRNDTFSIHFDFGIAVHEALERHLTRKNPVTVDVAVLLFVEKLRELYQKNGPRYEKPVITAELEDLLCSGENILRNIDKCDELKGVEFVHNEYPLFEDIDRDDDVKMKFKGFIDIVIRTQAKNGDTVLYVCDFKTCSWGWDGDARRDRWKQYQLFLYKYYLCKKFDIDPKFVRTAFILLKKRPPKGVSPIEFFPVSAGPISVQRAIDTLHSNITEMRHHVEIGQFEKNRNSCVDRFGNTCPFLNTEHCP
jgi:hypothetical protein